MVRRFTADGHRVAVADLDAAAGAGARAGHRVPVRAHRRDGPGRQPGGRAPGGRGVRRPGRGLPQCRGSGRDHDRRGLRPGPLPPGHAGQPGRFRLRRERGDAVPEGAWRGHPRYLQPGRPHAVPAPDRACSATERSVGGPAVSTSSSGRMSRCENSHAETDEQLHPLREVPRWEWPDGATRSPGFQARPASRGDELGGALGDGQHGRVRVRVRDHRHHRRVGHPQPGHAVHAQLRVHDRAGIRCPSGRCRPGGSS